MRKRFRSLLAVLLVAVVGGLAWQVTRPREPVYQGKPLSYWLVRPARDPNFNALRALGTNAIPTLLQMLRAKDWTDRSSRETGGAVVITRHEPH
jgi:hypothetical protein